jgi:hypothetical protein
MVAPGNRDRRLERLESALEVRPLTVGELYLRLYAAHDDEALASAIAALRERGEHINERQIREDRSVL